MKLSSASPRQPSRVARILIQVVPLVLAAVFIFSLSYILGHTLLTGPLPGRASGSHLAVVEWLNRFFPHIPYWYPQEGGGISLRYGAGLLAHLLVVVTHRITGLTLVQAFRLISFSSIALTGLGIYFLGWTLSKKKTVGLIAAGFSILAPVTWTWFYDEGLFSQTVALVFLPFALAFFDRYLDDQLAQVRTGARRIWLVATVLAIVGASLSDLGIGAATALSILLYALISAFLRRSGGRNSTPSKVLGAVFVMGVVSLLVIAFYLVPSIQYREVVSSHQHPLAAVDRLALPTVLQFLGLSPMASSESLMRIQFPWVVALFFIVGTLIAVVASRKTFALCIISVLGLFVVAMTASEGLLGLSFPDLGALIAPSTLLLVLTVLLPVGAGYGVWSTSWTILHPRTLLSLGRRRPVSLSFPRSGLQRSFAFALALGLAGVSLTLSATAAAQRPNRPNFGPLAGGIDLDEFSLANWPAPSISDEGSLRDSSSDLFSLLSGANPTRIDFSPNLVVPIEEATSQLNTSLVTSPFPGLSLIQDSWQYQKNVFFSREPGVDEHGNPRSLNSVAQWFGTEYVFLSPQQDRIEIYDAAGWNAVHQGDEFELWRYPGSLELATLATTPAILVTERPDREIYMSVFRLANGGLLPYEEALLVEGRERIDSYGLEDLQHFDVIFLVGYDYRNREKAWETLASYVEQGGSLFVDTGWQFAVAEWQFDQAPEVLPVSRLTWTDYGMTDEYSLDFIDIAGEVDVSLFKPLVWEGQAWQLSGAQPEEVRDWGRVVLSANGRPLIVAGEYGEGRVVWSGMNLINHAMYLGQNEEEILLLNNLLAWTIAGRQRQELAPPSVERIHPDRVSLAFGPASDNNTWLYWREAYYPNWHAYLIDGIDRRELPIYRGGPGFMAIPVGSVSTNVTLSLEWELSNIERVAVATSVIGVILLGALFIDGLLLGGNGFTWLKIAVLVRIPSPFLGEGSNKEWAERKRAELEAGELHPQPRIYQPSEAIRWMPDKEIGVSAAGAAPSGSEDGNIEIELPIAEKDETLLQSWLDSTGHSEDGWAKKLLGKRRPSEKD